ncbi:translocator protein [Acyrthosiphon pisum]|uniref:Translocator protein n=1 Tax=Acyrthosiphon pisum TaxID=7029 RepID=A0A8R2NMS7_ACYPI|nr:translocator protein [Acyrthosiphon pisum]XP_016662657.1 translocator protein [Acyrthosiphon pisum]XP_029343599.1 translocator protein [Acyrthosiphon pisum]|eukprot:XP_016662656.1 PREDICTED: translocator protein [Acyrthosiphon pisum]
MGKITIPWIPIIFTVTPIIGGLIGGIFVRKNIRWYETLNLPYWRPPSYLFAPVWTTLYLAMGYASYLIYRSAGGFSGEAKIPLALYASQLVLNWDWPPLFFGLHKLKWGLVEICVLWINIASCIVTFYKINKVASYLMIPYLGWVSYATALTYYIYKNNPEISDKS